MSEELVRKAQAANVYVLETGSIPNHLSWWTVEASNWPDDIFDSALALFRVQVYDRTEFFLVRQDIVIGTAPQNFQLDFLMDEDSSDYEDDVGYVSRSYEPPKREPSEAEKHVLDHPEEIENELVEALLRVRPDKDLAFNPRRFKNQVLSENGWEFSWDAQTAMQAMQKISEAAIARVEERMDEYANSAVDVAIRAWPDWYRECGQTRLSRKLVGLFWKEQGYKVKSNLIDQLHLEITRRGLVG